MSLVAEEIAHHRVVRTSIEPDTDHAHIYIRGGRIYA